MWVLINQFFDDRDCEKSKASQILEVSVGIEKSIVWY